MAGKHPDNYCPVFGNYPKEYNRAVHGQYYPWVDYRGIKDTPWTDVKLGEFKSWFARREKTPAAFLSAVSRMNFRYYHAWMGTRYGSLSKPYLHLLIALSVGSLITSYGYYKAERNHKYHW